MTQKKMQGKKWSELSPGAKRAVIVAAVVHFCVVGVVQADLSRRPAEQIRGPKWLWRLLTAANTSFSVAYLTWGRRRPIR